jgi:hypothetical protein
MNQDPWRSGTGKAQGKPRVPYLKEKKEVIKDIKTRSVEQELV